jgi:hypothetical protein
MAPPRAAAEARVSSDLVRLLVALLVAVLFSLGTGCALALVRVILPGLAAKADRSLGSLGTARLLVSGVLPLIGALLLSEAIAKAGAPEAVGLVVWIPLLLVAATGALAALPHVGERMLRRGRETSLLARAAVGGLVVGCAMATWLFPPLGLLVTLLVGGWLVGIGLGLWGRNTA